MGTTKKKVLIISPDPIQKKMAGPGIRYWNFAKTLSCYFEVVLFTPNNCELEADFKIFKIAKEALKKQATDASCIILQGMTLWNYSFLKKLKVPIIVDLYDPFIFENLEQFEDSVNTNNLHHASLSVLLDQLIYGDYFICASEKQKDFWIGMLAAINRINPTEYQISKTLSHLIGVVPFGIEDVMPTKTETVLKGVFPGILATDKVVIWGGGLWDWLDPLTAINAVSLTSKKREDLKLFFMGTKQPNVKIVPPKIVKESIELSNSLGLTNKYVFFNDWVDYEVRHNYLLEADIGLSLHYNHLETMYSYRTRMLDYIWCDLPIISTSGDVMSEIIHQYKLGDTIPEGDYHKLSELLISYAQDEVKIKATDFKEKNRWSIVVKPMVEFINNAKISSGKKQSLIAQKLIISKNKYFVNKIIYYLRDLESLKQLFNKFK